MPNIAKAGSTIAKAFGLTLGGKGVKYFISLLQGSASYTYGYNRILSDITKTTINIINFLGNQKFIRSVISNLNGSLISSAGESVQSSDTFTYASAFTGVTAGSNGDYYVGCSASLYGDYSGYGNVIKLNSSGTITATYCTQYENDGYFIGGMAADASNLYVPMNDFYYGGYFALYVFDLNLNLQKHYIPSNSIDQQYWLVSEVKLSDNYVLLGGSYYVPSAGQNRANIILKQKSNLTATIFSAGINYNTSGSIYVAANLNDNYVIMLYRGFTNPNNQLFAFCFTTAGALVWNKAITGFNPYVNVSVYGPTGVVVVNSDNTSFCVWTDANQRDTYILKLNSSGSVIFARKFVCTTSTVTSQKIQSFVVKDDVWYFDVMLTQGGNTLNAVLKLPADGSLTQSFSLGGLDFSYVSATISTSDNTNYTYFGLGGPLQESTVTPDTYTFVSTSDAPGVSTRLLT